MVSLPNKLYKTRKKEASILHKHRIRKVRQRLVHWHEGWIIQPRSSSEITTIYLMTIPHHCTCQIWTLCNSETFGYGRKVWIGRRRRFTPQSELPSPYVTGPIAGHTRYAYIISMMVIRRGHGIRGKYEQIKRRCLRGLRIREGQPACLFLQVIIR